MLKPTHASTSHGKGVPLRIGFVPLIDSAPLIAAHELGFFAAEGLRVSLVAQLGWANVRDKLTYGQLEASHALLGMPVASAVGWDWFAEPLVSVMSLGRGGNAITLSRRLVDAGVRSAATLAQWVRGRRDAPPPVLAHVFGCSMHHYLLREWLSAGGVDPDRDVRLCVIPPPQVAEHMRGGHLDGFCCGEPWNTLTERGGYGAVVAATTDILPDHPEKVLAVSRRWASHHGQSVTGLIRALLRSCAWCDADANRAELARMLANPKYVNAPPDVIEASLRGDLNAKGHAPRPPGWRMRSFAVEGTFPSGTHAAWIAEQMRRWGHVPPDTDPVAVAKACTESRYYRQAAEAAGVDCPEDEFAPMPLRNGGSYDPRRAPGAHPVRSTGEITRCPT